MRKCICFCLLILFLIGSLSLSGCMTPKEESLDFQVLPIEQVNYNNYMGMSRLDYKGNKIAWANHSLTVVDDTGEHDHFSGISEPFQLLNDRIVFLKGNELFWYSPEHDKKHCISWDVSQFIATEEGVFYTTQGELYRYSWTQASSEQLQQNIELFYLHHDRLYAIDADMHLMVLDDQDRWEYLCTITTPLEIPMQFMPQGDFLITKYCNELVYTNIYTGATESIAFTQDSYANNKINYICDDQHLYVSFQATKTNGSLVRDIDHADNGVWYIDAQRNTPQKLCEEVFQELYLFEGNQLFGVIGNQIYQIDTVTGEVQEITR